VRQSPLLTLTLCLHDKERCRLSSNHRLGVFRRDTALKTSLNIDADGLHSFSSWSVETMPGGGLGRLIGATGVCMCHTYN
jgi:hypothetical protein